MVREVIRHEKNFGNTTLAYDIALLKVCIGFITGENSLEKHEMLKRN
jgi:hypothetical protein